MSKYFVDNLTHWEKMIIFAPTNNNEIERDMIKMQFQRIRLHNVVRSVWAGGAIAPRQNAVVPLSLCQHLGWQQRQDDCNYTDSIHIHLQRYE